MSDDQKLARLFDALADSVEEMTDEEILAEARDFGEPKAQAARVAAVVEKSAQAYGEHRRAEARRQYDAAIEARLQRLYTLPPTAGERRRLLVTTVTQNPGIRSAVTLQHRELRALSDDDVEGYLKKLIELGILGEGGEGQK